jgi:multidrug efflux pump subunit AcrA (membrane-fusion protein)
MSEPVDLRQLATQRPDTAAPTPIHPQRRWVSRYGLPGAILAAFAGLLVWAAKDSLLPSTPVTVVPVVLTRAEVQAVGTPLFQAAGWIEPRPAPVVVSSLAPGVIDQLLVIEGQLVTKGDPLARLLPTDARIVLGKAKAELAIRAAEVDTAQANVDGAKLALDNPIQLRAEAAEAESAYSKVEAELNSLPAALEAAKTRWQLAEETVKNRLAAGNAVPGRVLRQAQAELATEKSAYQQLVARQPVLKRQQAALARRRDALQEQLTLKLDLKRQVAAANAMLKAAEAREALAALAIETAELQLKRMTITAPINGRVLALMATVGKRVVGIDPHSLSGAAAIATLYDPRKLQIRVDVRLEDIPQVQLGQKTRIETASAPGGLVGEVISITSTADIQKNTLQVKVAVLDPPDVVRPEMLAQVTFLASPTPRGREDDLSEDPLRILVPRQLITTDDGATRVWLADQTTNTATRRTVTLGRAGTNQLIEVVSGLSPTDRLISGGRESLQEGQRIRITAEDNSLNGTALESPPTSDVRSVRRTEKTQTN